MVVCFPDSCRCNPLLSGSFDQSAGKLRVGASYSATGSEIIFGSTFIWAIRACGPVREPLVCGWIFAGRHFGATLMAVATGYSRDALNTYLPAFFAAGVLGVIAAAAMLFLPGKRNPTQMPAMT
jgi:hypothetical protein